MNNMENINKYELTITADSITSTDSRFTMDDLNLGDNYKPLDSVFIDSNGNTITRQFRKNERKTSNQTLPKLAFQLFEKQLTGLNVEERETFPVCQYKPDTELICGIYSSVNAFKKDRNTIEYLVYYYGDDREFVIYSWNVFSTIIFVQECLKRFGDPGDKFVFTYRDKTEKEMNDKKKNVPVVQVKQEQQGVRNKYSSMLLESKNLIFRGAPGTGKSYLAREIATDIVSDGMFDDYTELSDEQKQQIEFVQFHPSYDYSDFVEGLRPRVNEDGSMGFELQDGIFKKFVNKARKNYEESQKPQEIVDKETAVKNAMSSFFSSITDESEFQTKTGNKFYIARVDDEDIDISIPANPIVNKLKLKLSEIQAMLESDNDFSSLDDIRQFFKVIYTKQRYSYDLALYNEISKHLKKSTKPVQKELLKKYIFIIDEINRGEISKIFGELFFSIDPGYRGTAGEISTQYANLHTNPNDKFYIPENVYIIGTMNDIDRSVDSFDFAMRRRFRFVEIKADEHLEMLSNLEDEELENEAIARMTALNNEIVKVEDLNENYQIGASYFLKLKTLSFDQLWTDYLRPLLQEYVRGMYEEDTIMNNFAKAYGYNSEGDSNASSQN